MKLTSENYDFIFCDFEFSDDMPRKSDVFHIKNTADAENLFYRLLRYYKKPDASSFSQSMSFLYRIYGLIHLCADGYVNKTAEQKAKTAKEYIDLNLTSPDLSVSAVSDVCKISEVTLRKLFKSVYGVSPSHYIISMRIKKSQEFMKYPFLSLEDCALQSGFSTLQYFSRVFKQTVGETPARYRQKTEKMRTD